MEFQLHFVQAILIFETETGAGSGTEGMEIGVRETVWID